MIKIYTEKDYIELAVRANNEHKLIEEFVDTVTYPIYDEEGNIIGYTEPQDVLNIRLVDNPQALAMMKMTPLDFLKALNKLGITYDTIKEIIKANPEVEMEMNYCQNVYRGHPMIEQFAKQYGISDETLDYIFKKANGEVE